jgi:hypothetical protein
MFFRSPERVAQRAVNLRRDKKVVPRSNRLPAKNGLPCNREPALGIILRSNVALIDWRAGGFKTRQRPASLQILEDISRRRLRSSFGHDIGDQPPGTRGIFPGQHNSVKHVRVLTQRIFDFVQFDSKAVNLDLPIDAAEVFDGIHQSPRAHELRAVLERGIAARVTSLMSKTKRVSETNRGLRRQADEAAIRNQRALADADKELVARVVFPAIAP